MSFNLRSGVALVAALGVSLAAASAAQARGLEDVEGEGTAAGVGPAAERMAIKYAINDWKREVQEEYGFWPRWKTAVGKRYRCDAERTKTECEVEATPTR